MARKSLPNFCTIVVLWRRCGPPLDSELDPSGISLLSAMSLSLSVFSALLPPIFSALQFLPLFGLDIQTVLFLPALGAGPLSWHIFWLIQPHSSHCQSQRN